MAKKKERKNQTKKERTKQRKKETRKKKKRKSYADKDLEKVEFSSVAGGNAEWYSHFGNQVVNSLRS